MNNPIKVPLDNEMIIVKIMNKMCENEHFVHYTLIDDDFQQINNNTD